VFVGMFVTLSIYDSQVLQIIVQEQCSPNFIHR